MISYKQLKLIMTGGKTAGGRLWKTKIKHVKSDKVFCILCFIDVLTLTLLSFLSLLPFHFYLHVVLSRIAFFFTSLLSSVVFLLSSLLCFLKNEHGCLFLDFSLKTCETCLAWLNVASLRLIFKKMHYSTKFLQRLHECSFYFTYDFT